MTSKRRALAAFLIASSSGVPAQAGCLDWLFNKNAATTPTTGFAMQPTVTAVGPLTPVGPPVISQGYIAGFAPFGGSPSTSLAGLSPAAAAQAPAFGAPAFGGVAGAAFVGPIDNPSVLTGRPVMQTSAMQPSFNSMGQPMLPPAAMTPPMQPSGPASWFSKMIGNDYQSSYNNVPTTTFRPVTQIDPATGAMVTVQQPCTSTTQQLQRSPYSSLQPATGAITPYYGEPTCGSEPARYLPPNTYAPQAYAPQTYAPQTYAPQAYAPQPGAYGYPQAGDVSQATAIGSGLGYNASPIPSSAPAYGSIPSAVPGAPQPLRGYGEVSPSDATPMTPPQLDLMRPAWPASPSNVPSAMPSIPPSAFPQNGYPTPRVDALQAPPLSTTQWSDRGQSAVPLSGQGNFTGSSSLGRSTEDRYSDIPPIPAANEYTPPQWSNSSQPSDGVIRDRFGDRMPSGTTISAPRTANQPDPSLRYASAPNASSFSTRDALPTLPPMSTNAIEPKRDDSGWFVIEPQ